MVDGIHVTELIRTIKAIFTIESIVPTVNCTMRNMLKQYNTYTKYMGDLATFTNLGY